MQSAGRDDGLARIAIDAPSYGGPAWSGAAIHLARRSDVPTHDIAGRTALAAVQLAPDAKRGDRVEGTAAQRVEFLSADAVGVGREVPGVEGSPIEGLPIRVGD